MPIEDGTDRVGALKASNEDSSTGDDSTTTVLGRAFSGFEALLGVAEATRSRQRQQSRFQ